MSFLNMSGLAKSFGDTQVLHDFSIELEEGEILALLGLSGSGKTTALRLLAGFEQPDRGKILVDGVDVTTVAPEKRGFGMVFQHYALFPHMTVAQNIAFGLDAQGWDKPRIAPRVEEMLELVNLQGFGERKVSAISGGQQQRVALARALAPEPRLMLLDEPLSNLDPALREKTREELRAAVRQLGITTVLVTHEQEEAFHVGDKIAVLHHGHLQQVGRAVDLYRRPASPFVASFIGRSSRLSGVVETTSDGSVDIRIGNQLWPGRPAPGVSLEKGQNVSLVIRPEALRLRADGGLPGRVVEERFTGALSYAVVEVDAAVSPSRIYVTVEDDELPPMGESVSVCRLPEGPTATVFADGAAH